MGRYVKNLMANGTDCLLGVMKMFQNSCSDGCTRPRLPLLVRGGARTSSQSPGWGEEEGCGHPTLSPGA